MIPGGTVSWGPATQQKLSGWQPVSFSEPGSASPPGGHYTFPSTAPPSSLPPPCPQHGGTSSWASLMLFCFKWKPPPYRWRPCLLVQKRRRKAPTAFSSAAKRKADGRELAARMRDGPRPPPCRVLTPPAPRPGAPSVLSQVQ